MTELRDMRVLIVDDNEQMRRLLAHMLQAAGLVRLVEAATAGDAIASLRSPGADVMIVDWKMTPVDGIALTRKIRSGEAGCNPCVPIVMLTAHTEGARVAAARDAGVTGFVKKPVAAQLLFDRVASALTDSRMFVRTPDFFGPDRRHFHMSDYAGPFRRATDQGLQGDTLDLEDVRLIA